MSVGLADGAEVSAEYIWWVGWVGRMQGGRMRAWMDS